MTATVEHIKKEIESLAPDEAMELFRVLQHDYPVAAPKATDEEASIHAAWDNEVDVRLTDLEAGRVELISAEDSKRRIDSLFARHGLQRRTA